MVTQHYATPRGEKTAPQAYPTLKPLARGKKRGWTGYDAVLNAWARRDAAADIRAAAGVGSIKTVYSIVQAARAAGDPRAALTVRQQPAPAPPRPLFPRLGLTTRTVKVTTLGVNSHACHRVEVTVSDLPPRAPKRRRPPKSTSLPPTEKEI